MPKRWAAGLFIALCFMYNGSMAAQDEAAKAACVMELTTGRVLYGQQMHRRLPMASTTKVMTALLAIERGNLDDEVTCAQEAYGVPGTSIYLQPGERLTLEELLMGLMLSSGNDAAVAIAVHIGGTQEGFIRLMNERAEQLGVVNTHFANPHGLPDDAHYTTAYDLALIARQAMNESAFRRIVSTQQATIPWEGRTYARVLKNKNRLLAQYPGATGIKTGFTSRAGRCLVFGARRDGLELVGTVLGCPDWFNEAERLMDGCYDTYSQVRVLEPGREAARIAVEGGREESVSLCVMDPVSIPLAEGESAGIVLELPDSLRAPVYPGMPAGTAYVTVGAERLAEAELVAAARVDEQALLPNVERICLNWLP